MDITTSNIDEGGTAAITVSYSGMLHQGSTVRVSVTAQSDTATGLFCYSMSVNQYYDKYKNH